MLFAVQIPADNDLGQSIRAVLELCKNSRPRPIWCRDSSAVSRRIKACVGYVWDMWCREGTLYDPSVGGGSATILKNFRFLSSKRRIFVDKLLSAKMFLYNHGKSFQNRIAWRLTVGEEANHSLPVS